MNIESIKNYIQISERLASSGQPADDEFKSIADAGFQIVINLAMPNSANAIPDEGSIVTSYEMTYMHLPVPFERPTAQQLKTFMKLVDVFADQKIWIHCVVNHRVSAFLYQYHRLALGATHEEAKKVMLPSWKPNDVWRRFMELRHEDLLQY